MIPFFIVGAIQRKAKVIAEKKIKREYIKILKKIQRQHGDTGALIALCIAEINAKTVYPPKEKKNADGKTTEDSVL